MKRAEFLKAALRLVREPYVWGGRFDLVQHPERLTTGGDCWGLVYRASRQAGGPEEWRGWWTDRAWAELQTIYTIEPGALAFYGKKAPFDVDHVAIQLGSGLILTTTRGGRDCESVETAKLRNALVTVYTVSEYEQRRHDFLGLKKLPFED